MRNEYIMSIIEKSVEELVSITYANENLQAYIVFNEDITQFDMNSDSILQMLKNQGIIFGIKEDVLQKELSSISPGDKILIAEGNPAVDGKNGRVEYFYEKQKQSDEKEEKRYPVRNVRKGETIAVIYPPEEGQSGTTVRGETIVPGRGKPAVIHTGKNTTYADESNDRIVAAEDGNLIIHKGGYVEVQPELVVQGNYDSQMGMLDFVGSVVINGDINPGVRMRIGKMLVVKGSIRDAYIDVGEAVIVEGGFIGKGEGRIQSEGTVKLTHVWHQQIIAKGDIEVKREIVGGRLRTSGNIIAPDATLTGGLLEAERDIVIKNLGCGEASQGKVRAGIHSGILESLEKVNGEIKLLHKQIEEIDKVVYQLVNRKIEAGSLPDDQEERLRKLRSVKNLLPQNIEALNEEKKSLQNRLEHRRDVRVKVKERVHENVVVNINGVAKIVQTEIEGAEFLERNGCIEIRALE